MNLGSGEVLVILLVALLVLGPTRLPEAARQVGKTMRTIRQVSTGFQDEMRHAIEDTIEADAAKEAGVSHTPASRPGARRRAEPSSEVDPGDDQPDPGGPTDLTAEPTATTADGSADPDADDTTTAQDETAGSAEPDAEDDTTAAQDETAGSADADDTTTAQDETAGSAEPDAEDDTTTARDETSN